jgi:hypothetical protein
MIEATILAIEIAAIYTIYDAIQHAKGAAKRAKLKRKLRGVL